MPHNAQPRITQSRNIPAEQTLPRLHGMPAERPRQIPGDESSHRRKPLVLKDNCHWSTAWDRRAPRSFPSLRMTPGIIQGIPCLSTTGAATPQSPCRSFGMRSFEISCVPAGSLVQVRIQIPSASRRHAVSSPSSSCNVTRAKVVERSLMA